MHWTRPRSGPLSVCLGTRHRAALLEGMRMRTGPRHKRITVVFQQLSNFSQGQIGGTEVSKILGVLSIVPLANENRGHAPPPDLFYCVQKAEFVIQTNVMVG